MVNDEPPLPIEATDKLELRCSDDVESLRFPLGSRRFLNEQRTID
jgi:hypothetical protein